MGQLVASSSAPPDPMTGQKYKRHQKAAGLNRVQANCHSGGSISRSVAAHWEAVPAHRVRDNTPTPPPSPSPSRCLWKVNKAITSGFVELILRRDDEYE